MRLDRLHPSVVRDQVRPLWDLARRERGRTHWAAIRTSPADGVQVGLKLDPAEGRLVVYLRRPGGREDFREMAVILQALGVDPKAGNILQAHGRNPAPHGWGPPSFLVALVPLGALPDLPLEERLQWEAVRDHTGEYEHAPLPLEGVPELAQAVKHLEERGYVCAAKLYAKRYPKGPYEVVLSLWAKRGEVQLDLGGFGRGSSLAEALQVALKEIPLRAWSLAAPIPMGKGQLARAREVARALAREVASLGLFLPVEGLYVPLETRAGRGKKPTVAHRRFRMEEVADDQPQAVD